MKLLVRVDADSQMGTGHVMRCLALGQRWQDFGGQVTFALALCPPALEERLLAEGMSVIHLSAELGSTEDAEQTGELAKQLDASWIVLDGYHFDEKYETIIKNAGLRLLLIDDIGHFGHCFADIILNQNLHAHPRLYPTREPGAQLLLGPDYALLRREFGVWRGHPRQIPLVAQKVLVTLGGSDPDNVTLKVIQALSRVELANLEGVAIAGGANPHYQELEQAVAASVYPIRLLKNIKDMPGLMAWADIAVSSGGSTCWELAFMGLPSLTLVLADNQQPIGGKLDSLGVARNLGWGNRVSEAQIAESIRQLCLGKEERAKMSRKGRRLVDGKGCERVLARLTGS